MSLTPFGRVVRLQTERARHRAEFRIGLEAVEKGTGRLTHDPTTEYEGDGIAFRAGDVLFGKLRPNLAKSWLADRGGEAVGDFHVYRPISAVMTSRYLAYIVLSDPFLEPVIASVYGAKMPRADWGEVRNLKIWVPSRSQQIAITEYLDRETRQIDALIAKSEHLVALLTERRASLIDRTVFGWSDKMIERQVPEFVEEHAALRDFVRRTPIEWRVGRFKAHVRRRQARNVFADAAMKSLKITGEVVDRMSQQHPDEASIPRYLLVAPDDLVINPMWLVGGALGVSSSHGAVSPDYRVFRIRPTVHPRFLHHLLRSRPFRNQFELFTRAETTFDRRVQQADIDRLPIPLPEPGTQTAIAKQLDQSLEILDSVLATARRSIDLARERRAALISAAMTGKIDVGVMT